MIERKLKVCKDCGQPKYIWAYGRCKECDARYKLQDKPKSDRIKIVNHGEKELFDRIWAKREHLSYVSGVRLDFIDKRLYHNLFHHVLAKKNYSLFRLEEKNIILLTPQEHLDIHSLAKDKLLAKHPNWQKVFDLSEELKELYKIKQALWRG